MYRVTVTAAKVQDDTLMDNLLHRDESMAYGDEACTCSTHNLLATDPHNGRIWCVPFKKPRDREVPNWQREINRGLARLRAISEFPFRVVKRQLRFANVPYRGLLKNGQALTTKSALSNLYTARRTLLKVAGQVCPEHRDRKESSAAMSRLATARGIQAVFRLINP